MAWEWDWGDDEGDDGSYDDAVDDSDNYDDVVDDSDRASDDQDYNEFWGSIPEGEAQKEPDWRDDPLRADIEESGADQPLMLHDGEPAPDDDPYANLFDDNFAQSLNPTRARRPAAAPKEDIYDRLWGRDPAQDQRVTPATPAPAATPKPAGTSTKPTENEAPDDKWVSAWSDGSQMDEKSKRQTRVYQIFLEEGLDEDAARAAVAETETEGGLLGADNMNDPGGSYGPWQLNAGGGEFNNFVPWVSKYLGRTVSREEAKVLADDVDLSTRFAAQTYQGRVIKQAQASGIHGAALATYAQAHGQVSVDPGLAGQNYERLFANGDPYKMALAAAKPGQGARQASNQRIPPGHWDGDGHDHGVATPYTQQQVDKAGNTWQIAFDYDAKYDHPFNPDIPRHRGVDLIIPDWQARGLGQNGKGAQYTAFRDGVVEWVTQDPNGGIGIIVRTGNPDAPFDRYFHNNVALVKKGDPVKAGETVLGQVGETGTQGFPHLHYEVSKNVNGDPMGSTIDPRPFMSPPERPSSRPATASGTQTQTPPAAPPRRRSTGNWLDDLADDLTNKPATTTTARTQTPPGQRQPAPPPEEQDSGLPPATRGALEEWQRFRKSRGEDPTDLGEFRAHLGRLGAPDPWKDQEVAQETSRAQNEKFLATLPGPTRQALEEWQTFRRQRGEDVTDQPAFEAHLDRLGVPNPWREGREAQAAYDARQAQARSQSAARAAAPTTTTTTRTVPGGWTINGVPVTEAEARAANAQNAEAQRVNAAADSEQAALDRYNAEYPSWARRRDAFVRDTSDRVPDPGPEPTRPDTPNLSLRLTGRAPEHRGAVTQTQTRQVEEINQHYGIDTKLGDYSDDQGRPVTPPALAEAQRSERIDQVEHRGANTMRWDRQVDEINRHYGIDTSPGEYRDAQGRPIIPPALVEAQRNERMDQVEHRGARTMAEDREVALAHDLYGVDIRSIPNEPGRITDALGLAQEDAGMRAANNQQSQTTEESRAAEKPSGWLHDALAWVGLGIQPTGTPAAPRAVDTLAAQQARARGEATPSPEDEQQRRKEAQDKAALDAVGVPAGALVYDLVQHPQSAINNVVDTVIQAGYSLAHSVDAAAVFLGEQEHAAAEADRYQTYGETTYEDRISAWRSDLGSMVADWGRRRMAETADEQLQIQQAGFNAVQPPDHPTDWSNPSDVAAAVVVNAPITIAAIGMARAGAPMPVVGRLASGLLMYGTEGGDAYQTAIDGGVDRETAIRLGVAVGSVNAWLEEGQIVDWIGDAAGVGAKSRAVQAITRGYGQSALSALQRGAEVPGISRALRIGMNGIEEGAEEIWQGGFSNIVEGTYNRTKELNEGLLEGFAGGFIPGALLGSTQSHTRQPRADGTIETTAAQVTMRNGVRVIPISGDWGTFVVERSDADNPGRVTDTVVMIDPQTGRLSTANVEDAGDRVMPRVDTPEQRDLAITNVGTVFDWLNQQGILSAENTAEASGIFARAAQNGLVVVRDAAVKVDRASQAPPTGVSMQADYEAGTKEAGKVPLPSTDVGWREQAVEGAPVSMVVRGDAPEWVGRTLAGLEAVRTLGTATANIENALTRRMVDAGILAPGDPRPFNIAFSGAGFDGLNHGSQAIPGSVQQTRGAISVDLGQIAFSAAVFADKRGLDFRSDPRMPSILTNRILGTVVHEVAHDIFNQQGGHSAQHYQAIRDLTAMMAPEREGLLTVVSDLFERGEINRLLRYQSLALAKGSPSQTWRNNGANFGNRLIRAPRRPADIRSGRPGPVRDAVRQGPGRGGPGSVQGVPDGSPGPGLERPVDLGPPARGVRGSPVPGQPGPEHADRRAATRFAAAVRGKNSGLAEAEAFHPAPGGNVIEAKIAVTDMPLAQGMARPIQRAGGYSVDVEPRRDGRVDLVIRSNGPSIEEAEPRIRAFVERAGRALPDTEPRFRAGEVEVIPADQYDEILRAGPRPVAQPEDIGPPSVRYIRNAEQRAALDANYDQANAQAIRRLPRGAQLPGLARGTRGGIRPSPQVPADVPPDYTDRPAIVRQDERVPPRLPFNVPVPREAERPRLADRPRSGTAVIVPGRGVVLVENASPPPYTDEEAIADGWTTIPRPGQPIRTGQDLFLRLRTTPFLSQDELVHLLGDRPEDLDQVVRFMMEQRQKVVSGQLKPSDVAKAYFLTVSSQGQGAIDPLIVSRKTGLEIPEHFLTATPDGRWQVRPEDAAAAWLASPPGQEALADMDEGVYNLELWRQGAAVRGAFSDDRLANLNVLGDRRPARIGRMSMRDIPRLTAQINANGSNPRGLDALVGQLNGIGPRKTGFIQHLLGFGEIPTVDARAINVWLTGSGDIRGMDSDASNIARALNQHLGSGMRAGRGVSLTSALVVGRIMQGYQSLRRSGFANDIPAPAYNAIMHGWLWSKVKNIPRMNAPIYGVQAAPVTRPDPVVDPISGAPDINTLRDYWEQDQQALEGMMSDPEWEFDQLAAAGMLDRSQAWQTTPTERRTLMRILQEREGRAQPQAPEDFTPGYQFQDGLLVAHEAPTGYVLQQGALVHRGGDAGAYTLQNGALVARPDPYADQPAVVSARERAAKRGVERVRQQAQDYVRQFGIRPAIPSTAYVKNDRVTQQRIAAVYEAAVNAPEDPEARAAYGQMAREVEQQYQYLLDRGVTFIPYYDTAPAGDGTDFHGYNSSPDMIRDIAENNRLYVYADSLEHPLLSPVGVPYSESGNWKFRGVHDYFGHAAQGYEFGPRGEESAWLEHVKMFSPLAARAMTTETRGQNSWANFRPGVADLPLAERGFAEQKVFLLPGWALSNPEAYPGEYRSMIATAERADDNVVLPVDGTRQQAEYTAASLGRDRNLERVVVSHVTPTGSTMTGTLTVDDAATAQGIVQAAADLGWHASSVQREDGNHEVFMVALDALPEEAAARLGEVAQVVGGDLELNLADAVTFGRGDYDAVIERGAGTSEAGAVTGVDAGRIGTGTGSGGAPTTGAAVARAIGDWEPPTQGVMASSPEEFDEDVDDEELDDEAEGAANPNWRPAPDISDEEILEFRRLAWMSTRPKKSRKPWPTDHPNIAYREVHVPRKGDKPAVTATLPVFVTSTGAEIPLPPPDKGGMGTPKNRAYNELAKNLGGRKGFPSGLWTDSTLQKHTYDSPQEVAFMVQMDQMKADGLIRNWYREGNNPRHDELGQIPYHSTNRDKGGIRDYKADFFIEHNGKLGANGDWEIWEAKPAKVIHTQEEYGIKGGEVSGKMGWDVVKKAIGISPVMADHGVAYILKLGRDSAKLIPKLPEAGVNMRGRATGRSFSSLPGVDWRDLGELDRKLPASEENSPGNVVADKVNSVSKELVKMAAAMKRQGVPDDVRLERLFAHARKELLPTADFLGRTEGRTRNIRLRGGVAVPRDAMAINDPDSNVISLDDLREVYPGAYTRIREAVDRGVTLNSLTFDLITDQISGTQKPRLGIDMKGDPAVILRSLGQIGVDLGGTGRGTYWYPDKQGPVTVQRIDFPYADGVIQANLQQVAAVINASGGGMQLDTRYNRDGSLATIYALGQDSDGTILDPVELHGRLNRAMTALSAFGIQTEMDEGSYPVEVVSISDLAGSQDVVTQSEYLTGLRPVPAPDRRAARAAVAAGTGGGEGIVRGPSGTSSGSRVAAARGRRTPERAARRRNRPEGGPQAQAPESLGAISPDERRRMVTEAISAHEKFGGSTINLERGNLAGTAAYSVSLYPELGVIWDDSPTPEALDSFVDEYQNVLSDPRVSLGTWHNVDGDGKHYIDVSVTLTDRDEAVALARMYNQIAIFDLAEFEDIKTGGTGVIPEGGMPPVEDRLPPAGEGYGRAGEADADGRGVGGPADQGQAGLSDAYAGGEAAEAPSPARGTVPTPSLEESLSDQELLDTIVQRANAVLADWNQDEDGYDEVFGGGGICDTISQEISEAIMDRVGGVGVLDGGQDGDDHAYSVIYRPSTREAFAVDIPPHVYETGGGYSWRKIEGVQVTADDITIDPVPYDWIEDAVAEQDGPFSQAPIPLDDLTPDELLALPEVVEGQRIDDASPLTINDPNYDSPERQAIRDDVVRNLEAVGSISREVNGQTQSWEPAQDRQAWIVIGPPAAGKSSVVEPLAETQRARIIDSDKAKELLPEFDEGRGATAVHEESSEINATMLERALDRGDNVALPVVGKSEGSLRRYIDLIKGEGYDVHLISVELPIEIAARRAVGRLRHTGRFVPIGYLLSVGDKPLQNYQTLKVEGGLASYARFDKNTPRGADPILIESSAGYTSAAEILGRPGRRGDAGRAEDAGTAGGGAPGAGGVVGWPDGDQDLRDQADEATQLLAASIGRATGMPEDHAARIADLAAGLAANDAAHLGDLGLTPDEARARLNAIMPQIRGDSEAMSALQGAQDAWGEYATSRREPASGMAQAPEQPADPFYSRLSQVANGLPDVIGSEATRTVKGRETPARIIKTAAQARGQVPPVDRPIVVDAEGNWTIPARREADRTIAGRSAGQQALSYLLDQGVKADEIAWMGLAVPERDEKGKLTGWSNTEGWLMQQQGQITRSDFQAYLDANAVSIEEVLHSDAPPEADPLEWSDPRQEEGYSIWKDSTGNYTVYRSDDYPDQYMLIATAIADNESLGNFETLEAAQAHAQSDWSAESMRGMDPDRPTKYKNYTLPQGENYRELLLTIPDQNTDIQRQISDLYAQERVLNRLENPTPEQQAERDRLYAERARLSKIRDATPTYHSSHWDTPNIVVHARFDERADVEGKRVLFVEEWQSDWAQAGRKKGYRLPDQLPDAGPYGWAETGQASQPGAVSNQPFKKTEQWAGLGFRRMVRWAAEHGFDRIAWTTGAQQNDRYSLDQSVSQVTYEPSNGRLTAYSQDGQIAFDRDVAPEEVSDWVGEDVAQRLLAVEPEEMGDGGVRHSLFGHDLRMSGKGMKGFYDEIMPAVAAQVGKPFGVRPRMTTIVVDEAANDIGMGFTWNDQGEMVPTEADEDASWLVIGTDNRVHNQWDDRAEAIREAEEIGGTVEQEAESYHLVRDDGSVIMTLRDRNAVQDALERSPNAALFKPSISNVETAEVHAMDINDAIRQSAIWQGFPMFQSPESPRPWDDPNFPEGSLDPFEDLDPEWLEALDEYEQRQDMEDPDRTPRTDSPGDILVVAEDLYDRQVFGPIDPSRFEEEQFPEWSRSLLALGEVMPGAEEETNPASADILAAIQEGPNAASLSATEIEVLRGTILFQHQRLLRASKVTEDREPTPFEAAKIIDEARRYTALMALATTPRDRWGALQDVWNSSPVSQGKGSTLQEFLVQQRALRAAGQDAEAQSAGIARAARLVSGGRPTARSATMRRATRQQQNQSVVATGHAIGQTAVGGVTPRALARAAAQTEDLSIGPVEYVLAMRYNSMLLGPRGILVDYLSNSGQLLYKVLTDPILPSTGGRNLRARSEISRAEYAAIGTAFPIMLKNMSDVFLHGITADEAQRTGTLRSLTGRISRRIENRESALSTANQSTRFDPSLLGLRGAKAATIGMTEIAGRLKGMADVSIKALAYGMERARLAGIQAWQEGVDPASPRFRVRTLEIIDGKNVAQDVLERHHQDAMREAERTTYQGEMGAIGRGMEHIQKNPIGQFVLPFLRALYHIRGWAVDLSPLGAAMTIGDVARAGAYRSMVRTDLGQRYLAHTRNFGGLLGGPYQTAWSGGGQNGVGRGVADLDRRAVANVIGTTAFFWMMGKAFEGLISASGPPDDPIPYFDEERPDYEAQKLRQTMEATGWRRYSVKIGDRWYSYANWGPLGYVLAAVGAIGEAYRYGMPQGHTKADRSSWAIIAGAQGLSDLIRNGDADTTNTARRRAFGVIQDMSYLQGLLELYGVGKAVATIYGSAPEGKTDSEQQKRIREAKADIGDWLARSAVSMVPVGALAATIATGQDPFERARERGSIKQEFAYRVPEQGPIPWLGPPGEYVPDMVRESFGSVTGRRQGLPIRVDVIGRNVENPTGGLGSINPLRNAREDLSSPTLNALVAAGVGAPTVSTEVTYRAPEGTVGPKSKLVRVAITAPMRMELQRTIGQRVDARVQELLAEVPETDRQADPDAWKARLIDEMTKISKETTREYTDDMVNQQLLFNPLLKDPDRYRDWEPPKTDPKPTDIGPPEVNEEGTPVPPVTPTGTPRLTDVRATQRAAGEPTATGVPNTPKPGEAAKPTATPRPPTNTPRPTTPTRTPVPSGPAPARTPVPAGTPGNSTIENIRRRNGL